jgi:hypothetical protein
LHGNQVENLHGTKEDWRSNGAAMGSKRIIRRILPGTLRKK